MQLKAHWGGFPRAKEQSAPKESSSLYPLKKLPVAFYMTVFTASTYQDFRTQLENLASVKSCAVAILTSSCVIFESSRATCSNATLAKQPSDYELLPMWFCNGERMCWSNGF